MKSGQISRLIDKQNCALKNHLSARKRRTRRKWHNEFKRLEEKETKRFLGKELYAKAQLLKDF